MGPGSDERPAIAPAVAVAAPSKADAAASSARAQGSAPLEGGTRFGQVAWTCEGDASGDGSEESGVVWRRTAGSPWRVWKARELLGRDAALYWFNVVTWWDEASGRSHPTCVFLDETHAWVAAYLSDKRGEGLAVLRTADGGAHWTVARIGHAHVMGGLDPDVHMTFRDLRHGYIEFINPAQNRTNGEETRWTFGTRDGGAHWTLLSETATCQWKGTCD